MNAPAHFPISARRPTFAEQARKVRRDQVDAIIARMDAAEVVDLLQSLLGDFPVDAGDGLHDALYPACKAFEAEFGAMQAELGGVS